jgi:ATP-binding cassette subfamily F protein uup
MTLAALEEMLVGWPGCAIVVSHDRAFLNHVATSTLAMEEGKATLYPGNYDAYLSLRPEPEAEAKPAPRAAAAAPPSPAAPKKLTYAERLEYAGIMDAIAAAEGRVAEIERMLADPDLYASRAHEAKSLQEDLAAAKREVERLTARWEELEARV